MRLLGVGLTLLCVAMAVTAANGFTVGNGTLGVTDTQQSTVARDLRALGANAMLVGQQVLEVTDTRQLTLRADGLVTEVFTSPDGRYVAYLALTKDSVDCRLVKVSTGKTVTIMSRKSTDDQRPASNEVWSLDEPCGIAWSPDSSMFAFKATHRNWEAGGKSEQQYIMVYSAAGSFKKALLVHTPTDDADNCNISDPLLFTPDSRWILANLLLPDLTISEKYHPLKSNVRLINIATGDSRNVVASGLKRQAAESVLVFWSQPPRIVGWSENGALLCVSWDKGLGELHRLSLDGRSDEVLLSDSRPEEVWSPDGSLSVLDDHGLSIRSQQAGKTTSLISSVEAKLVAWVPNSRMILYEKDESVGDVEKARKRNFRSLWLSTIDPEKRYSLCVALDAERFPSSSRDCRRIAYISQGQLYVAELTLREPTTNEKLAVDLPLTESETKEALLSNGKLIGVSILMYSADNDGHLPPADSVPGKIQGYVITRSIFCRPGGKDNVFRYIDPGVANRSDIANPGQTIIGELDAGYSWRVMIYADGHVAAEPKQ